jgi:transcriptional regulator with XRE-family HTH domain
MPRYETGASILLPLANRSGVTALNVAHRQSISLLRTRRGFTQQELADLVGVSRGAIARVEIGTLQMSDKLAEGIARVLGLSVADLNDFSNGTLSLDDATARMRSETRSQLEVAEAETLNAAVTLNRMLVEGLKRTDATLDQLDAVRSWFNAMGPVVPIVTVLEGTQEPVVNTIIDDLFEMAAKTDQTRVSASLALLRVLVKRVGT